VPPSTQPDVHRVPLLDGLGGAAPGAGGSPPTVASGARPSPLATGWFDDTGALIHALLWGAVCLAIVVASIIGIRRLGHRLLVIAVAAIPFAIALFFFYANVNRVVPSAL
jgi:hypothetical protein